MKWGVTKVKHPNKGHIPPNKGQKPMYQGVRYSESPLYILIHPCILGNRGVITKILTSPRQL